MTHRDHADAAGIPDIGIVLRAVDDAPTPAQAAARLVAFFHATDGVPDRIGRFFDAATAALAIDAADPLRAGGLRLAADIDRGVGAGIAHGYHNPRHFLEVMTCALALSRRAGLAGAEVLHVLVAALIHDFHHDGGAGGREPFRLERRSVDLAVPTLRMAGAGEASLRRIGCLVLATEPSRGARFARACHAFHLGRGAPPGDAPLPELSALQHDPALARDAALLVEADVLPSIALTVAHGLHVQSLFAAEIGRPLGAGDKLRFIDDFGELLVGTFFAPNRDALRAACLDRRAVPDGQPDGGTGRPAVVTDS